MKAQMFNFSLIIICLLLSCNNEKTGQLDYNHEKWPGKSSTIKTDIVISNQFVSKYNMFYRTGSTVTNVRFEIPLNENDSVKSGYLRLKVSPNPDEAQLGLLEYLEVITDINKPPRLTNEEYKAGDVAFGIENEGNLRMSFTRNNVLVIVYAQKTDAKNIAHEIDDTIQNAPEWDGETPNPVFILPD